MKKTFMCIAIASIVLSMLPLTAQVPYTPFPKESLKWHIWHKNDGFPGGFSMSGKDTLIGGNNYSEVIGYPPLVGVREENKKIYAFFPEFGEQLLYDFNLEIGDTIFYHIGLAIRNQYPLGLLYQLKEHHSVVIEKGTITLLNGSVRNTLTLDNLEGGLIQWIEGIGASQTIGLLDPLHVLFLLDGGVQVQLSCICEQSDCLLWFDSGNVPSSLWCSCSPNSINEYQENEVILFPNPTNGLLKMGNGQLKIKNIELFDIYGRQQPLFFLSQNSQETTMDISHLANGIYFLKIIGEDKSQLTKKFAKH